MANEQAEVLDDNTLSEIIPFTGVPQVQVQDQNNLLATGQTLQKAETKFMTAVKVQEPRQIARVSKNVLAEAKLAGSHFYYRWEVKTKNGRKTVQGGSIDLAISRRISSTWNQG